jgi:DMSO reductase family type II enzyme heme b subunit
MMTHDSRCGDAGTRVRRDVAIGSSRSGSAWRSSSALNAASVLVRTGRASGLGRGTLDPIPGVRASRRLGVGTTLFIGLVLTLPPAVQAQDHPGKAVYEKWCAECHGVDGRGDGPAATYMLPRPRDFTKGIYQIRTTPSGTLPSDADLLHIIDNGMPGTAMPGWARQLSRADRNSLVSYIKTFSRFFETEGVPEPIRVTGAPRVTDEGLAIGREFFESNECFRCHGLAGRGDGPSAHEQTDDAGHPIRVGNLTQNWRFNGGGTTEDIYKRLRTGLDGTPMPSFADVIDAGLMTDEQLWRVAQYVRSLSPEQAPRVRDVLRAAQTDEPLPTSPDDPAWADVDEFYFPLAGQIITGPRWFTPSVSNVWVKALHDDGELVLRVRWSDPSRSPENRWDAWQALMLETMEPHEGGPTEPQPFPDALAIQFSRRIPDGMEKPYFLMGNARDPVYLWRWQSSPWGGEGNPSGAATGTATEALARGLDRIEPLAAAQQSLGTQAVYDNGEWRVVLRRPLDAGEGRDRLTFEAGRAIPIAFFVWDGSNGEAGTRGAISTWYYIYLDQPTPTTVYVAPVIAVLLTGLLGVFTVSRAQRREQLGHAVQGSPLPEAAGAD